MGDGKSSKAGAKDVLVDQFIEGEFDPGVGAAAGKGRRVKKAERGAVERAARDAGMTDEQASIARQAIFSKKGGEQKLDALVQEMIAADSSADAGRIFDFLDVFTKERMEELGEKVGGGSLVDRQQIQELRQRFVTQASGPTLRATGLLKQLSSTQTGLRNG
jgi:hypothetical protein